MRPRRRKGCCSARWRPGFDDSPSASRQGTATPAAPPPPVAGGCIAAAIRIRHGRRAGNERPLISWSFPVQPRGVDWGNPAEPPRQTVPACEVIVVDDGSTTKPLRLPRPSVRRSASSAARTAVRPPHATQACRPQARVCPLLRQRRPCGAQQAQGPDAGIGRVRSRHRLRTLAAGASLPGRFLAANHVLQQRGLACTMDSATQRSCTQAALLQDVVGRKKAPGKRCPCCQGRRRCLLRTLPMPASGPCACWAPKVVAVEEVDILAACGLQACVACGGRTAVRAADDADRRRRRGNRSGFVGRTVINHNHLACGHRLGEEAPQGFPNQRRAVARGNDHRYGGGAHCQRAGQWRIRIAAAMHPPGDGRRRRGRCRGSLP